MTFSRKDTCHYISEQLAELERLAARAKLDTLAYLLSVAQAEADKKPVARAKSKTAA
jgi:hypothetical protein